MSVTGVTGYLYDAADLRTYARNITELGDEYPGQRAAERQYASRHGVDLSGEYPFRPRIIRLGMVVLPNDASGAVTHSSPVQHVDENIDALKGLFYRTSGYSTLSRVYVGGYTRTLDVRVVDPISFRRDPRTSVTRGVVVLRSGYPFWHGAARSYLAQSSSFAAAHDGNAPVNDMVVTFNSAGRVTIDGRWIESSISGLTVNVGLRTARVGSTDRDDALSTNDDWMLVMPPGGATVTLSGGADIDLTYNEGWL